MSRSGVAEETKARDYHKDNMNVSQEGEEDKKKMAEGDTNLFSDANESTKLYKNSSMLQNRKVSIEGFSVHPEILVQETEDVYSEENANDIHCSLGAPSAASIPLAAANSLLFNYGDDDNDVSMGILDGIHGSSPCKDTVDAVTNAKDPTKSDPHFVRLPRKSLSDSTSAFVIYYRDLPKSDSQFPIDLSYT